MLTVYLLGGYESPDGLISWEVSTFNETPSKVVLICGKSDHIPLLSQFRNVPEIQSLHSEALSVRLFYKITASQGLYSLSVDSHRSLTTSSSRNCRHTIFDRYPGSARHTGPEQTSRKQ